MRAARHEAGAARKLYELLLPYHEQVIFIGATAALPVAFYLGELASVLELYGRTDAYFAEATELDTRDAAATRRYARVECQATSELANY